VSMMAVEMLVVYFAVEVGDFWRGRRFGQASS
jgi:hypothetical protein